MSSSNLITISASDSADLACLAASVDQLSVVESLPLLAVSYGTATDEDFLLWLSLPGQDATGVGFTLLIGDGGDVATLAGAVQPGGHVVRFYAPAATGPTQWADTGAGGAGPGTYAVAILASQTGQARQIVQPGSYTLGESIPASVGPAGPVPAPSCTAMR